jgi:hypothetical protein
MARCPAIKPNGERCKAEAAPGAAWCYSHDPARSEERRRNASRGGRAGGRGRGSSEISAIKAQLVDLTRGVLAGDLSTGMAAVANQLLNTRLRALQLERTIREQDELEARIEALERAAEGEGGRGLWGA